MWRLNGILSAYWKYPTWVPDSATPDARPQVVQPWAGDLGPVQAGGRSQGANSSRDTAQRSFFFSQAVLLKEIPKRNARCCLNYCIEGIFNGLGLKPIGCATSLFLPSVKETLFLSRWRGQRGCCLFAFWLYFYMCFLLDCCCKKWKEKKKCSLLENLKFPFMQQIILIVCSNCRVQITANH